MTKRKSKKQDAECYAKLRYTTDELMEKHDQA